MMMMTGMRMLIMVTLRMRTDPAGPTTDSRPPEAKTVSYIYLLSVIAASSRGVIYGGWGLRAHR